LKSKHTFQSTDCLHTACYNNTVDIWGGSAKHVNGSTKIQFSYSSPGKTPLAAVFFIKWLAELIKDEILQCVS